MGQVFAVSFVVFVIMAGFSILFPVLPFWATNIGASPFEVGIIFSMYPLAQIIASPVWGRLSDKYGYKMGIVIGGFGFAITSFLIPLYPSVIYLIIVRFLGGLISSAALPSSGAYIGAISGENTSTRNFGIYGASIGLGMVFGPFIGGLSSNFGIKTPFLVSGLMGLLATLIAIVVLGNASDGYKRIPEGGIKISPDKWVLIALGFVSMLIMVNFEVILALFIKDRFNLSAREVGYLMGFAGLVGAVVQGGAGRIVRYIRERTIISVFLLSVSLISLIVPYSSSFKALSLFVVLLTVFFSLSGPVILGLLSRGEEKHGTIMGIYQSSTSLGRILGSSLSGYLYSLGINLPFLFASALSFLAFVVWILSCKD